MALLGSPLKNQNLVNQISAAKIMRPAGFYKSIFVDFLGVLTALVAGLIYRGYLFGRFPFWVVLVVAGAFMIASVFGALLGKHPARRGAVLLAEIAALLTFFIFDTPAKTLILLAVVAYCLFVWGDTATRNELSESVEVRFFRITRPQFRKLTTALIAIGIVLYLPHWNAETSLPARPNFDRVFTWASGVANNFYPEIRFTSDVRTFAQSLAQFKLHSDPRFAELQQTAQQKAFDDTVTQIVDTMQQGLSVNIDLKESLSDLAYRFLMTLLEGWQKKFGSQFLIAWAIAAYLLLRSIGLAFYLVVSAVAFIFYQLLLAGNFIMVIGETRVQETVQYT